MRPWPQERASGWHSSPPIGTRCAGAPPRAALPPSLESVEVVKLRGVRASITPVARTRLKGGNSRRSETVRVARRRGAPGPILANSLAGRSRHSSPPDPLPSGRGGKRHHSIKCLIENSGMVSGRLITAVSIIYGFLANFRLDKKYILL